MEHPNKVLDTERDEEKVCTHAQFMSLASADNISSIPFSIRAILVK